MFNFKRSFRSIFATAVLASAVGTIACGGGVRVGYRAYDPYRSDYHVWNANESTFYARWATETHHDPHRDYRKLKKNDQENYWRWRHDHN